MLNTEHMDEKLFFIAAFLDSQHLGNEIHEQSDERSAPQGIGTNGRKRARDV